MCLVGSPGIHPLAAPGSSRNPGALCPRDPLLSPLPWFSMCLCPFHYFKKLLGGGDPGPTVCWGSPFLPSTVTAKVTYICLFGDRVSCSPEWPHHVAEDDPVFLNLPTAGRQSSVSLPVKRARVAQPASLSEQLSFLSR